MKLYILLPVYNRKEITQKFIECLKRQISQQFCLILIDDASTDGTEQMVRSSIQPLVVIRGNGNWWWAGCLHQGYLWLKANKVHDDSIILIVNDDTEFDENFLKTGKEILNTTEKTLLLAQCYSQQTNKLIDSGVFADWENFQFHAIVTPDRVNCLSTNGLFLKWRDFKKIGGFRPKLLPHYTSDYEFTIRAHRKGMNLITNSTLKIYSNESTTGYRKFQPDRLWILLRQYFSKKSAVNPIMLTIFIALSCPWRWKLKNWVRVWRGAKHQIVEFWILSDI